MSSILIKNGFVVTMDPRLGTLTRGDVLIRGDRIEAVGTDLEGPADKVIDASGKIVIPGLIDTHIHMWQHPLRGLASELWSHHIYKTVITPTRENFSAKDFGTAVYLCGLEMLDRGVTGALDFCHGIMSPGHARAAFDAHSRTGQRVLMAYGLSLGYSFKGQTLDRSHSAKLDDIVELRSEQRDESMVTLGVGLSEMETAGLELFTKERDFVREHGLRATFHQNSPGQILTLHERGMLGADLVPVHVNSVTDRELRLLEEAEVAISVTPEVEISVGRSMSVLNRALREDVKLCIGTDTPSRVSIDLLSQLRLSLTLVQAHDAQEARAAGRLPLSAREDSRSASPGDMLATATVNPAHALGLGDSLGTLAPGKLADVVLLETWPFGDPIGDPAAHAVLFSSSRDVDTVIAGGVVRKEKGALVGVDLQDVADSLADLRSRVLG
ncbi:amidohydrolase family protein [Sinosporangium siamense]|uniref:TRZ/ATZ family hydrolase n=1 Tax=Sinosporangium siamense TaxID=1367973 RepID=A0A919V9K2_9ACTN|nr:amidohydrolase family protein [Sinosporangium siamense]GII97305.1 TRZ/ATZ family hydrolase [Sinosporangium siamense]